jgi:hypothetical protein
MVVETSQKQISWSNHPVFVGKMVKTIDSPTSRHTPEVRAWSQQPSRKTKVPSLKFCTNRKPLQRPLLEDDFFLVWN